jgi:hypothetical protein
LDLIKIRFAGKNFSRFQYFFFLVFVCIEKINFFFFFFLVNDGRTAAPQYRGLLSAFSTIFKQEGFRGLYKGVTPNVWGSGSAWGFYFLL